MAKRWAAGCFIVGFLEAAWFYSSWTPWWTLEWICPFCIHDIGRSFWDKLMFLGSLNALTYAGTGFLLAKAFVWCGVIPKERPK